MDREIVVDRLTPLVREVFGKPELELTNELDATQIDTWTSFAFMQLLERIEIEFGFKFKMMELLKLQSMGAIIDSIQTHTA